MADTHQEDGAPAAKVWAGRLGGATAQSVEQYTRDTSDLRLLPDDVAGSQAHAAMLHAIGILDDAEHTALQTALNTIAGEVAGGGFAVRPDDEDIHTAVERRLIELAGDVGAKIHSGRSRNDQVATDLRLYARRACADTVLSIARLQDALIERARVETATVMPGYTHLQRAQPVTLAHHLLAYVEMLQRDTARLLDARKRCDILPLGSGALAASTLPLDREAVARDLRFSAVSGNSLDSVSDRDFAVEITAACALVMAHLSRLGEELVLWSSAEFGFVELPDTHATGSSLMPQKKNPDVAELARGRSGRVAGALVSLLMTLKGLPLAYNRDLQEDKRALFEALDTTRATVDVLADLIDVVSFNRERMRAAASDPALLATDVAEHLVRRGVPFRDAHRIVGEMVRRTVAEQRSLRDVTLD
ncbi:MAG: argininosuccinate lyase, partial [Candidatus Dormibacteraeota bacterium]|nr:argininosuccinate lyase [Candidatus Dormibacteraeota bacterium]